MSVNDPFGTPAAVPSAFPTVGGLRGRLVLIWPKKQETVPNKLGKPGDTQEQITANVDVVDGLGPVPVVKGNPPTQTGQFLDGPSFTGMWITNEVVVTQLRDALTSGGAVLGRIDTKVPGTNPGKGNAWGIMEPSEEDKQIARNFLANRTVGAAQAPAPAQTAAVHPVQSQPAPVFPGQPQAQQYAAQAQLYAAQAQAQPQQFFAAPPQASPPNPAAGNPFA